MDLLSSLDNLLERLPSYISVDLPGREDMSLVKDVFYLFQCPTRGLGETEEDVNERRKVERPKDEVGLPSDVGETGGNSPG